MTFFKTNLITFISKFVCLCATLFISIYIARFLGPSAKGVYYLLVQIVSILATISLFGIDTAAIYHLGKGYSSRGVIHAAGLLTISISILTTAGLIIAMRTHFLQSLLSETNYGYLIIIAAVIPFMSIARLNSAIVIGFNRYLAFNILNIILFVMMAINFIVFVVLMRLDLLGALLGFALAYFVMSIIYAFVIFNSKRIKESSSKPVQLKKMLGYGARVFLVPILLLLTYRIDAFFLSYYIDASAVGFYSVALSFAELLLFIPESTGTILFPKLAHTKPENIDRKFVSALKISIILTALVAIVFFAAIKYVLPFVYGAVYIKSVQLTYILLPGLFAMATYYLFSSYFQAVGKPGFVTAVLAIILIEKAVLSCILIPQFNIAGAAIATTISYFTCFLIFLTAFIKRAKLNMKEIFVLKKTDVNFISSSLNNIFDFQK